MIMQEVFWPADQRSLEVIREQNGLDVNALLSILLTHYPNGCNGCDCRMTPPSPLYYYFRFNANQQSSVLVIT